MECHASCVVRTRIDGRGFTMSILGHQDVALLSPLPLGEVVPVSWLSRDYIDVACGRITICGTSVSANRLSAVQATAECRPTRPRTGRGGENRRLTRYRGHVGVAALNPQNDATWPFDFQPSHVSLWIIDDLHGD
jgi:hypothetical protein